MKIFAFDPSDYRARYEKEGWVHIKNGINPEFLTELQEFTRRSLAATKLDHFAIKGKKEQSLYEFPESVDFPGEIFDVVSAVCGLKRASMTLSERHIQAYEPDANPDPEAHKDRYPSQVSLGFSISIPPESRLVLYPYDHRELNPFNSAASFHRSLQPHELPNEALKNAREVQLDDRDGDIVMFPGSTTWHLRTKSANAVNLYVKLNDFDCDPLGEDPTTHERREQTLAFLQGGGDGSIVRRIPAISRRLDFISRQYGRQGIETLHISLYAGEPMGITETQLELMRVIDGTRPLGSAIEALAGADRSHEAVEADALLLIEHGFVDLIR